MRILPEKKLERLLEKRIKAGKEGQDFLNAQGKFNSQFWAISHAHSMDLISFFIIILSFDSSTMGMHRIQLASNP